MANPWLSIPLADYESHMSLPEVAQAQLLADVFESLLKSHRPASVAVIGCAGGNGFDRIDPDVTTRVAGVDINPHYIDETRRRYDDLIPGLELVVGDIESGDVHFDPVDLVYAALVLEYVDVGRALDCIRPLLARHGVLATVIQLPGARAVTPSPIPVMETLASVMHLMDADVLEAAARHAGYRAIERRCEESRAGKAFMVQTFAVRGIK